MPLQEQTILDQWESPSPVFAHPRNDEKLAVCKDRGANVCINYKMEDFVKRVKEETVKLVENAYKLHFWEYLGYHGKERTLQRTRKQLFVALWGHV
ncbi:hypothetical protein ACB092_05G077100 [Castanea dentata]